MRLPRRRLRTTRRLARPGRPGPPPPGGAPLHEAPTEIGVPSVLEDLPNPGMPRPRSQETTVTLAAIQEDVPPREIAAASKVEPKPPQKLEFSCTCGAQLVATTETYDKHSRCAMCQTVLLLNLVYDGDQRSFEIVPFRVNPESGPRGRA